MTHTNKPIVIDKPSKELIEVIDMFKKRKRSILEKASKDDDRT